MFDNQHNQQIYGISGMADDEPDLIPLLSSEDEEQMIGAAENVDVKMIYRLSAITSRVDHQAIAALKSLISGYFRRLDQKMT